MRYFAPAAAATALTAMAIAGSTDAQVPAPDFCIIRDAIGTGDGDAPRDLANFEFETRAGRVSVHLPADMRAGDTISGTVVADPAGRSEEQCQRNLDTLNGYVVDIDGRPARRAGRAFAFTVPAAGALSLSLLSADGRRLGHSRVPVVQAGGGAPELRLPRLGQQGRPLQIPGPFDGNLDDTSVRVGGAPAVIIAESPRGVIVRMPEGSPGPVTLEVSEGSVERRAPINRIVVSLNAPRTALRRGERTTLSVRVDGLQGIVDTGPVALSLTGSRSIALDGGNVQTVTLQPDAAGSASFQRGVTARAPGSFQIRGTIVSGQAGR